MGLGRCLGFHSSFSGWLLEGFNEEDDSNGYDYSWNLSLSLLLSSRRLLAVLGTHLLEMVAYLELWLPFQVD